MTPTESLWKIFWAKMAHDTWPGEDLSMPLREYLCDQLETPLYNSLCMPLNRAITAAIVNPR